MTLQELYDRLTPYVAAGRGTDKVYAVQNGRKGGEIVSAAGVMQGNDRFIIIELPAEAKPETPKQTDADPTKQQEKKPRKPKTGENK